MAKKLLSFFTRITLKIAQFKLHGYTVGFKVDIHSIRTVRFCLHENAYAKIMYKTLHATIVDT